MDEPVENPQCSSTSGMVSTDSQMWPLSQVWSRPIFSVGRLRRRPMSAAKTKMAAATLP